MDTQKNTTTEEKIVKGAKALKTISQIAYIVSCALCIAFIVLAIVLPITGKDLPHTPVETCLIFVGLALYSFFLIGVLWNTQQIFVVIEETKSPFGEKVTKYIKKTGIFIMITSVVPALIQGLFVSIFARNSDIYSSIQVGGVVAGLVLYMLGYFFKYGEELKKRDNETL